MGNRVVCLLVVLISSCLTLIIFPRLAATYPKQLVKKQILKSAIQHLMCILIFNCLYHIYHLYLLCFRDDIFGSPVPLSLRLFSILMHGLAVIYEKQAE